MTVIVQTHVNEAIRARLCLQAPERTRIMSETWSRMNSLRTDEISGRTTEWELCVCLSHWDSHHWVSITFIF